ncbi:MULTISPECIES: hypothetical protein [Streptomyces]|uniref:hypothetical protein n=1 Tax=Streptomyces TaxID=1883 RepID=UPI0007C43FCA|nr:MULTISPECIES: hypothetical protein [Streptomyces]RSO12263.1 hypothetical protein DMH18_07190 [Streptomyces sp. WAC 06783]RSO36166.1 hypothetical protein DMH15_19340 [Streptomyces sp. WAC 06725]
MSTYDERGTGPAGTPEERAASEGMPPPERGAAAYEGTGSAQQPAAPPPTTTSGAESVPGVYAGLPGTETDYPAGTPEQSGTPGMAGSAEPLLPAEAREKLRQRLDHAVNGFVDRPREAVQEADGLYEELAALLPEALAARRRSLRTTWEQGNADTEQLRVALRHYRETAQRLLDF